ncbi:MAG: glycosyltransferase family 4 protein [Anaerolineae bacterium]
MRILFISSYYPPHFIGGWEQLVRDISEQFVARGHTTHILTSTHGVEQPEQDEDVSRILHVDSDVFNYDPIRELKHKKMLDENLKNTEKTIQRFKPDVIYVHLMYNLSHGVPWMCEQLMPDRVAYWIANDWPYAPDPHTAYWLDPAGNPVKRALKSLVGKIPLAGIKKEQERFQLRFKHVMCVSQAVLDSLHKEAGIPHESLMVLNNGVETELFKPVDFSDRPADELRVLYAGSVNVHKGVHTILEAFHHLNEQNKLKNMSLTIVGDGHPDYENRLKKYVADHQLQEKVHFHGRVLRSQMHELMREFNILAFPSVWEEPLSRMMQEGMSAGLTVVGTLTGGSGELLVEGETGLTFDKENHLQLANRLLELQADPELCQRLADNGRAEILKRFSMERMIDNMEEQLTTIVANSDPIFAN